MPYLLTTTINVLRDDRDIEATIEGSYAPERPAPPCSNPSSPAYSDPGDPEEIEILEAREPNGLVLELTDAENEQAIKAIRKEFLRLCEENYSSISE